MIKKNGNNTPIVFFHAPKYIPSVQQETISKNHLYQSKIHLFSKRKTFECYCRHYRRRCRQVDFLMKIHVYIKYSYWKTLTISIQFSAIISYMCCARVFVSVLNKFKIAMSQFKLNTTDFVDLVVRLMYCCIKKLSALMVIVPLFHYLTYKLQKDAL